MLYFSITNLFSHYFLTNYGIYIYIYLLCNQIMFRISVSSFFMLHLFPLFVAVTKLVERKAMLPNVTELLVVVLTEGAELT